MAPHASFVPREIGSCILLVGCLLLLCWPISEIAFFVPAPVSSIRAVNFQRQGFRVAPAEAVHINERPESILALGVAQTFGLAALVGFGVAAQKSASRAAQHSSTTRNVLNTAMSGKIFTEAQDLMPGGVSSPVRAFNGVEGNPIVFNRVKGAHIWDVDDNKYIDWVVSWGAAIAGHADDEVIQALQNQLKKGTSFGAPSALENTLAKMIIERVPSVEMVRFTNSGTEACMSALRLARAYSQREKLIKFDGCYHGHGDSFLVNAGSGIATLGLPDSPGAVSTNTTFSATYGNLAEVETLLKNHDIAAVMVEPVCGNAGFIASDKSFLQGLRQLTQQYGALLIFDEVMSGFRVAYGGAQEHYGVTPDLTTMGKVIGGGLPVGAFGGRRDIMEMIAPAGPLYRQVRSVATPWQWLLE